VRRERADVNDVFIAVAAGLIAGLAGAWLVSPFERRRSAPQPDAPSDPQPPARLVRPAVAPAARAPRRRRRSYLLRRSVRGAFGALVSSVLVVIPAAVFVRESLGGEAHQATVPLVHLRPVDVARFAHFQPFHGSVPVLTYHDLSDSVSRSAVSPQLFAEQMAMLRAAGFTSITAQQFADFLAGSGTLPAKPVLITFDDGIASAWRVADPILERYGMHAVLFAITGRIAPHSTYYLTTHELRDLRDSGRWDIEAHTDDGHRQVTSSPGGAQAPFLTNREWLQDEDRYETLAEYRARVGADLDRSLAKLRDLGVHPSLFAYPLSPATAATNDPRLVPILRGLVAARFAVSFVDGGQRRYVSRALAKRTELPRFRISALLSADGLFGELEANAPRPLPHELVRPFANWFVDQHALVAKLGESGGLRFAPPPRTWISAHWAPRNALPLRDATLSVVARRLGTAQNGSAVTLVVRPDDNTAPATVTVGPASIRVDAATSLRCRLRSAPSHRLGVAFHGGVLQVAVDGRRAGTLRLATSRGSGIGLGAWRDAASSPAPVVATIGRSTAASLPLSHKSPLTCTTNMDAAPVARGGRSKPQPPLTNRGVAFSRTHAARSGGTA
jgi:poly-beta-1,6-N-acetyl-D-glucosamine N-deacetylase